MQRKILSLVLLLAGFFPSMGVALDVVTPLSSSTGSIGANGSRIQFSPLSSGLTQYVNTDGDATDIGNQFAGYYVDTIYGPFRLDWSSDSVKNVSIVGSTPSCADGFGYLLGGYVRSEGGPASLASSLGYIGLSTPRSKVYYCPATGELYGRAFSSHLGFVSFDGLRVERAMTRLTPTLSLNDTVSLNRSSSLLNNLFASKSSDIFTLQYNTEELKDQSSLSGAENRSDARLSDVISQKLLGGQFYATEFGEIRDYVPGREEFFYIYK